MSLENNFQLMAEYNQWMNEKLYEVSSTLPEDGIAADRGAFFKSILGTLNHILVADTIWLKRFLSHPARFTSLEFLQSTDNPKALAEILYSDFSQLRQARQSMDASIIEFVHQAKESDYEYHLPYRNTQGNPYCKKFGLLVHHFFNHQTHHRGQLTVLLSQAGLDFGSTDLLGKIPGV
ncbi:MAG: DinB family protein [Granulosicoccus sp.]